MNEGDCMTLTAIISPSNATNRNVCWSSSDESVASVESGNVTALKAGRTTITVTTEDGGLTADCQVTVNPKIVNVEGVSLDRSSIVLTAGESTTLTATVSPSNATNRNVLWSVADASVASVENGKVTARKAGSTAVTATTEYGGLTASCQVTVNPKIVNVEGVSLNRSSITLTEGRSATLTATVSPSNATNRNVLWSSADALVASVENGKVTALKVGSTAVTATTEDGGLTASCKVTVNPKPVNVEGVSLDRSSITLMEGESTTLTATVSPSNATNRNVLWSVADASVASVENGKVTALKTGSTAVTATAEDGGLTADCQVTVNPKFVNVKSVRLNKSSITLAVGESVTLKATVSPSNATDKNVRWSSSDESVASVENGNVTALKTGSATVTVTTEDGGLTASATVKSIVINVEKVSLDKSAIALTVGESATLTVTVSPSNATDKNVRWSSSDASVASVENGKVTALKTGSTTVTVTTEDGGLTRNCLVTVYEDKEAWGNHEGIGEKEW